MNGYRASSWVGLLLLGFAVLLFAGCAATMTEPNYVVWWPDYDDDRMAVIRDAARDVLTDDGLMIAAEETGKVGESYRCTVFASGQGEQQVRVVIDAVKAERGYRLQYRVEGRETPREDLDTYAEQIKAAYWKVVKG